MLCNALLFIYNYNNDVINGLFTERVQGYLSPALFKAAIIADRICVLNFKTNAVDAQIRCVTLCFRDQGIR